MIELFYMNHQPFAYKATQYDNFDWIDSNLIVHNLLTLSLDYFSFMHFLASSSYF